MPSIRSVTATCAVSALLAGLGVPTAFAQDTATDPGAANPTHQRHGNHKRHHRHHLTDAQLTTVATALGTTLEALKAATANVKAAVGATPEKETKAERQALLATELGVTVDALRAAFASVRGTTDGTCKPPPTATSTGS
jgi:hypothetical protein